MSELRIVTKIEDDWYGEQVSQEFYLDGDLVGDGFYGGEPEDNSYSRDYAWVDVIIAEIAKRLGATVTFETKSSEDEE